MRRRDFCLMATAILAASGSAAPSPVALVGARELFKARSGRFLAVGPFHEFGSGDFLFDYYGNRAGKLVAAADGAVALAPTFDGTGEPLAHITSIGRGVLYENADYAHVDIRRRAFEVPGDGATLHGEIAMRAGAQPRGVVAMIYGSGPAPKEAFDFWAFWFVAKGWAVVAYDKRGSGESGGDWRLAGLETLAADAAAVVAFAREEAALKGLPLGVWGASQAGWVMPQLGAKGLVDFILMHAGATMTPGEQILAQVDAELQAYGFPPEEIEKARIYYALDTDVSRGRRPWADIDAAYRIAVASGAEWLAGPPAPANAPARTMIRLMADFDPAPYWRESRAPLLAIFGGKDVIVPAAANAALLMGMIPAGVDLTVSTLSEANHLGFIGDTGVRAEYAKQTMIDPGYFPLIENWLKRRF